MFDMEVEETKNFTSTILASVWQWDMLVGLGALGRVCQHKLSRNHAWISHRIWYIRNRVANLVKGKNRGVSTFSEDSAHKTAR